MAAGEYDLTIEQGADYLRTFVCQTLAGVIVDLTPFSTSGLAQVRTSASAPGDPLAVLTVTFVDPVNGKIRIALLAAQTSLIPETGGVWDLFVTGPGGTRKLLYGRVNLEPAVSHG